MDCVIDKIKFLNRGRNGENLEKRIKNTDCLLIKGKNGYIKSSVFLTKTKKDFNMSNFKFEIEVNGEKGSINYKIENNKLFNITVEIENNTFVWDNHISLFDDEEQYGILEHFEYLINNNKIAYDFETNYLNLFYANIDNNKKLF